MSINVVKFHPHHALQGAVGAPRTGPAGPTPALNNPVDVLFVQRLLNRNLHAVANFRALAEDGISGPKTITAIIKYQRQFVTQIRADGRVDPGGVTIRALKAAAGKRVPAHVTAFLAAHAAAGKAAAAKWKVPASVLLAQAAHESGWGRHVRDNAFFGIKGKSPKGASTSFRTTEVINGKVVKTTDSFRAYKDFAEAAHDYGQFLSENRRYRRCFDFSKEPMRFVDQLAKAGYATDPDYATKIKNTIRKYGLTDYDQP